MGEQFSVAGSKYFLFIFFVTFCKKVTPKRELVKNWVIFLRKLASISNSSPLDAGESNREMKGIWRQFSKNRYVFQGSQLFLKLVEPVSGHY